MNQNGYTNIDGLDPSEAMLKQAKQKGVYNRLICDYAGKNQLYIPNGISQCFKIENPVSSENK